MNEPTQPNTALTGDLAEVLKREANFRIKMVREHADLQTRARETEKRLQELEARLAERDTYVHRLHLEREELLKHHETLKERDTYIHQLHLEREELMKVHATLAQRDAYIHELHLERERLQKLAETFAEKDAAIERLKAERTALFQAQRQEMANRDAANADLVRSKDKRILELTQSLAEARASAETMARELENAHYRIEDLSTQLRSLRSTFAWALAKPFAELQRSVSPVKPLPRPSALAAYPAKYYIHTPLHLVHRSETLRIDGWAFSTSGDKVLGIRARLGEDTVDALYHEKDEAARAEGSASSANPDAGFSVLIKLPKGRSHLFLEIEIENTGWRALVDTPLFRF